MDAKGLLGDYYGRNTKKLFKTFLILLEDLKTENRGQSETLENMEGMIIKLIGRWNQSDDKLDRKFDALTKEINDLDNQVSRIDGSLSRINGKH